MTQRALALTAALCSTIALISIFTLDRSIALMVHNSGVESADLVVKGREFLDNFTGRRLLGNRIGLGQLELGVVLLVVGVVGVLARRTSSVARALIFAAGVQIATIETAWLVKDYFGRMRPYQLIASDDWNHVWFAGGNSFPSGHNAFFWGLFLPLAYLFPKYKAPLLIIPLFIAFARIDENYHFLSDVLAAIALAALITLIAAALCAKWVKRTAA